MGQYSVAIVEDDDRLADIIPHSYCEHGNGLLDIEDFDKVRETREDFSDDPAKALEQFDNSYDVVVLDNGLPWDWEGAEVLYAAGDKELNTELILYTNALGYESEFDQNRVRGLAEQNDDLHYIQKDREKLAERIDKALGGESPQTPQT